MDSHVYAYELDIMDLECTCYSSTNPNDVRFDVLRLSSSARVASHGSTSSLHTWFPPFAWRMAHCTKCMNHLGWSFSDEE